MAVESHDKKLDDLLKMVEEGKAQYPTFNVVGFGMTRRYVN